MLWGGRKPIQTRGQAFKAEQDILISIRAVNVNAITHVFVNDVHNKIDSDRAKDVQQKVFVYDVADLLKDPSGYSKKAFESAVGSSQTTPYAEELRIFADAVMDAARGQDYEVRIGSNSQNITIDFTNVTALAEARIAAEKAAVEAAEIAKKAAADKIAQ